MAQAAKIFMSEKTAAEELSVKEIIVNLAFVTYEEHKFRPAMEKVAALVGLFSSMSKGLRILAFVWLFLEKMLKLPDPLGLDDKYR